MATRNNRLIFPSFFGTKNSLENPLSNINTTDQLQPGELIFQLEDGKLKTNLTPTTSSYIDLGYIGDIITLPGSSEISSYEHPFPNQTVLDTTTNKFYRYIPGSTYNANNGDIQTGNGSKVYTFQGELLTVSSSIFTNLPTSDPRVIGRLFTTQSNSGNLTGQRVVLVSQG